MAPRPDSSWSSAGLSTKSDLLGLRLRTFLASEVAESTGYYAGWRKSATPAGRSWWVLETSERPTDASESGSLVPTPRPCSGLRSRGINQTEIERALRPLSEEDYPDHWKRLPNETDNEYWERVTRQDKDLGYTPRKGPFLPTPAATEYGSNSYPAEPQRKRPSQRRTLLPTVRETDADRGKRGDLIATLRNKPNSHSGGLLQSPTAAANLSAPSMAKWSGSWAHLSKASLATPSARDWHGSKASPDTMDRNSRPLNEQLRNDVAKGRSIGTAELLAVSCWMMGYPIRWLVAAAISVSNEVSRTGQALDGSSWPPSATRSSRKSRTLSETPSLTAKVSDEGL